MTYQSFRQWMTSEKGLVIADQIMVSGSAFATNLLLARALGLSAYGQFSAVVLIQLFLLSIQQAAGSGIYQVVWPGLQATRQKAYTNGLLYVLMGWLAALALAGGLAYSLLPDRIIPYDGSFLVAATVLTALFLVQDFLRKTLLVQQRAGRALWLDSLTNGSQMLLLAIAWLRGDLSLLSALWIIGLTFLPSVVLGLLWLKPDRYRSADRRLVWQLHRQQGGWMLLSALTQWLAGNFFIVAGGWWLGAATLGALRLAQYIFGVLNVWLQALESYVVPRAAQLTDAPDKLVAYLWRVLAKSLAGVLPVLLLLTLFAGQLLSLLGGADYQAFGYVMHGLSALYLLVVGSYPIRILLRVRHLNKHYFIGYALATGFSLATASWLIPAFQLKGILIGMFLSQAILLGYWIWVLQKNGLFTWKSFTLSSVRPIRPE